jgi:hypothetical protein
MVVRRGCEADHGGILPTMEIGDPKDSGALRRRFGVVKLWPEIKAAEDECIARLKISAKSVGLECLEVDSFARLIQPPHTQLTREDVDFVISLHFETPKRYDIFSFVALWNPLQFFHEWGYRRFTNNLLTHDDFLSCSSRWADDHVKRIVSSDPMREGPELRLYHSLSQPLFEPTTGDGKLFYTGINWERLGKRPARHQGLLNLLDGTGDLRIYGPKSFQKVDVWAGYKSYVGPVPFDGVSIVEKIHSAGISLVLSSEAHQESELMSNRLFESLAGGAVIICDENPFARRFFGDTLLYIDTTLPAEKTYAQVRSHLEWIKSQPAKAVALAKQAQDIFRKDFTLDRCLERIYEALPARKAKLESLYRPKIAGERLTLLLLMPEFDSKVLDQHIDSFQAQANVNILPVLIMDRRDAACFAQRTQNRLDKLTAPIVTEALTFYHRYPDGSVKRRRRMGEVIYEAISQFAQAGEYLCVVGPNERLFSDHLGSLQRTLQDSETAGAAWANVLFSHKADGKDYADLDDEVDVDSWTPNKPLGLGRFLFRASALVRGLDTTLPYLDALSMHLLAGTVETVASRRCTLMLDIQNRFNTQLAASKINEEREILVDYASALFGKQMRARGHFDCLEPASLSLDRMAPERRTKLAVDLAHSVPVPALLKRIGFGLYRRWYRAKR